MFPRNDDDMKEPVAFGTGWSNKKKTENRKETREEGVEERDEVDRGRKERRKR